MLLLPLGLDEMVVKRVPAVSVALAIGCVLGTAASFGMGDDAYALAFVPAEGLVQIGWLTSMFLHGGVLHLIANLVFFYLAGPVIEDAWGGGRFLALFVLGDVVGNLGIWLLDSTSTLPAFGSSAAVAACMGALCVQYPRRQVRMFVWYWMRTTTFFVPVVMWGGLWLLLELSELVQGTDGAAMTFAAHLGGFAFGIVMALFVRTRDAVASDEAVPAEHVDATADAAWGPSAATTGADGSVAPASPLTPVSAKPKTTSVETAASAAPTSAPQPRVRDSEPSAATDKQPHEQPRKVPKAPRLRSELG